MHITNQKLSFDIFTVGNLLNIFMEHDLNILMIFGIRSLTILYIKQQLWNITILSKLKTKLYFLIIRRWWYLFGLLSDVFKAHLYVIKRSESRFSCLWQCCNKIRKMGGGIIECKNSVEIHLCINFTFLRWSDAAQTILHAFQMSHERLK